MRKLIVLAALLLTACATPQSPQQSVFQAKSGYQVALTAAVAYKRLPVCSVPAKPPCSEKAIVAQLQRADNVTAAALDAAESAVRSPNFGQDVTKSAIAAAQSALNAFVAITSQLSTGAK